MPQKLWASQNEPIASQDDQDEQLGHSGEQTREAPEVKPKITKATLMWALLLARIYECLPLTCPRCQNSMRIVALITDPDTIHRILTHLGEPTEPPPLAPARGPPQHELFDDMAYEHAATAGESVFE